MRCERERESEKDGRMTWTSVGAAIMTWRCLEEKKKILSVSAFNLYWSQTRACAENSNVNLFTKVSSRSNKFLSTVTKLINNIIGFLIMNHDQHSQLCQLSFSDRHALRYPTTSIYWVMWLYMQ